MPGKLLGVNVNYKHWIVDTDPRIIFVTFKIVTASKPVAPPWARKLAGEGDAHGISVYKKLNTVCGTVFN